MDGDSIITINKMNDLAVRSLPPDLFELWSTLFDYYEMRKEIDRNSDLEEV